MCLEFCVQDYLHNAGISLLSECDVLAFVYRHGANLTSTDQIARLIGYESGVVCAALDRLEREKIIERTGVAHDVCFHRLSHSENTGQLAALNQLLRLLESRGGRLLLSKLLHNCRSLEELPRTTV